MAALSVAPAWADAPTAARGRMGGDYRNGPDRAVMPPSYYGMQAAERSGDRLREVVLSLHNAERRHFRLAPLQWDEALARDAQRYADEMAQTNLFRHSAKAYRAIPSGENLWMGPRLLYGYEVMVGAFSDEKRYFRANRKLPDFSTSGRWQDVGHYTQMIWSTTRSVGCALGDGRNYEYLVCRYFPAGNIFGKGPLDADDLDLARAP